MRAEISPDAGGDITVRACSHQALGYDDEEEHEHRDADEQQEAVDEHPHRATET